MAMFEEIDTDLMAMSLGDDLTDEGQAYEPVDVPGTGSSTTRKYRPILDPLDISVSPAGANPRDVIASGVQQPKALWILSTRRGVTLQEHWLVHATVTIGNCTRKTWLNVIGPEHPQSHEILSRWLCETFEPEPTLM